MEKASRWLADGWSRVYVQDQVADGRRGMTVVIPAQMVLWACLQLILSKKVVHYQENSSAEVAQPKDKMKQNKHNTLTQQVIFV